jgi:hypothetical protein
MIVQNLEILKDLRVKTDLFEQVLADLMILDHAKHADLLDASD